MVPQWNYSQQCLCVILKRDNTVDSFDFVSLWLPDHSLVVSVCVLVRMVCLCSCVSFCLSMTVIPAICFWCILSLMSWLHGSDPYLSLILRWQQRQTLRCSRVFHLGSCSCVYNHCISGVIYYLNLFKRNSCLTRNKLNHDVILCQWKCSDFFFLLKYTKEILIYPGEYHWVLHCPAVWWHSQRYSPWRQWNWSNNLQLTSPLLWL